MRRRRRRHSSPAPALPLEDVLLRLPPLPSALPRASLVCKRWRGILSDPRFLGCYRRHHRRPPLLGFMTRWEYGMRHEFALLSRKKPRSCTLHGRWRFLGYRHGLAGMLILLLESMRFRRISERNGWDNIIIPSIMPTKISMLQAGELGGNGWIGNSAAHKIC